MFTVNIDEIDDDKFARFGDVKGANPENSWLSQHNILGVIQITHVLKQFILRTCDEFKFIAQRVLEKKELPYICNYKNKVFNIPPLFYNNHGKFCNNLILNGYKYKLVTQPSDYYVKKNN